MDGKDKKITKIKKTKHKKSLKNEKTRLESIKFANQIRSDSIQTPRMEDYLEVIYELVQQKGYATTVDISQHLNVSAPSVTKMVQRLHESGLLNYEKYRGINLTDEGMNIAISIRNRHQLLTEFFRLIGVDDETANTDAEGLEHYIHPESIKQLEKFVNFIKENYDLYEKFL